jgi:Flp pilus assembly protein TadB
MITALLAGALVALVAAPAARRLRPGSRQLRLHAPRRRGIEPPCDYAALLEAIARRVRSGSTLAGALVDLVEGFPMFAELAQLMNAGDSLADALAGIEPGDADAALTLQALSASSHLGGPIAATLDEAAAVLRGRSAARAERWAHGAQARLSARVLTIVPLGFAGWSGLSSQRTRSVYLSTFAGGACALLGLILNVIGWRWMKKLIGPA